MTSYIRKKRILSDWIRYICIWWHGWEAWKSTSLEWTEDVSPAGKSPILHWNGLMEKCLGWQLPILWKKDKTLSKMDRWMSLQQGSFPYFNGMDWWRCLGWQLPILQRDEAFYAVSSGKINSQNDKTCALSPPTNTEEDHQIIEKKLTALVEFNNAYIQ